MLHFVYGTKNSRKSEYISEKITKCLQSGERVILLVPERRSVAVEKAMISAVPDKCKLGLEVLSFRRLCNRVFREYGGLHDRYITRGGKILLLWRVLRELSPHLTLYKNLDLSSRLIIGTLLDTLTTLDRAALPNETLNRLAQRAAAEGNTVLSDKLNDIALIRAAFHAVLTKDFDDPEEDLTRLCHTLDTHPFFENYTVFIDETASFSGKELAVIRRILKQSPSVTVTIGKMPDDKRQICRKLLWCEDALLKEAKAAGCAVRTEMILPDEGKGVPALSFLRTHLFSESKAICGQTEGITVYSCQSRAEEADMIAARILDHVQAGSRWRSHAVALRNADQYRGILDRRLRAAGIPFYFADKRPLSAQPTVKGLLLALQAIAGNYRLRDLSAYMKTGFTALTFEECCQLEDYAKIWQIEGSRWKSDVEWCMNPRGRSIDTPADSTQKLETLNRLKNKLMLPLEELALDQKGELSVRQRAALLYRFYDKNGYPARILADAHHKNETGDSAGAMRLCQTNDLICECFDELVTAVGDLPCTLSLFTEMLTAAIDERSIGSIPQKNDEVLITDVFSLGNGHYDHLYIPGLCDGSFPASGGNGGLFSNAELKFLASDGIDLPGIEEHRASDEFFAFAEAVSGAKHSLTLSYPARDTSSNGTSPSPFIASVQTLFPSLCVTDYADMPLASRLGSTNMLKKMYFSGETGVFSPVFAEVFGDCISEIPYGGGIDADFALTLYGNSLLLSQSKLEKFIQCPFAYTCQYLFRLHTDVASDTAANEYGTLMHAVFEEVLREITAAGDPSAATDGEIAEAVQHKLNRFSSAILGENEDPRTAQLLRRAGATAYLLLTGMRDEFANSLFRPAFFELPFGMPAKEDTLTLPRLEYLSDKSLTAGIRGIADRVDLYRKDNTIYFRIVDYKTGNKEFDPSDLEKGLSGQMLLYMRAVCACKDHKFLSSIGADQNTLLKPAGIVYCIAKRPVFTADPGMNEKDILISARGKIARHGIAINEPDLLSALDTTENGAYLPTGKGKRMARESFEDMLNKLPQTLGEVTRRLHAGCTDIDPLKEGNKHDACQYCDFRAVCRRKDKKEGGDGE